MVGLRPGQDIADILVTFRPEISAELRAHAAAALRNATYVLPSDDYSSRLAPYEVAAEGDALRVTVAARTPVRVAELISSIYGVITRAVPEWRGGLQGIDGGAAAAEADRAQYLRRTYHEPRTFAHQG